MTLRIIYHEHCFDGCASAALFTRLYRERVDPARPIEYGRTTYTSRKCVDPALFADGPGQENAIVDFKYSSDPRVTWWFDHHQEASTFPTPEEAAHFAGARDPRKFYDPSCASCARLIWRVMREDFDLAPPELAELVDWADRIDGGSFTDAAEAVELRSPALRIGLVVQFTNETAFAEALIRDMQRLSLAEIERRPYVAERFAPLERLHRRNIEAVRDSARLDGEVLRFDVRRHEANRVDRYIPFYLFPEARYSVGLLHNEHGVKVSAAHNPWTTAPQQHSIAKVCELHGSAYGGGGHAQIGGISLGHHDDAQAERAAAAVVATLNGAPYYPPAGQPRDVVAEGAETTRRAGGGQRSERR